MNLGYLYVVSMMLVAVGLQINQCAQLYIQKELKEVLKWSSKCEVGLGNVEGVGGVKEMLFDLYRILQSS